MMIFITFNLLCVHVGCRVYVCMHACIHMCMSVSMCAHKCHSTDVEVRRQSTVLSLIPLCRSQWSNLSLWACHQVPLPTEPPHQLICQHFMKSSKCISLLWHIKQLNPLLQSDLACEHLSRILSHIPRTVPKGTTKVTTKRHVCGCGIGLLVLESRQRKSKSITGWAFNT